MRGWGRSSTHVTPSVTSGTYSPGPAIREPPAMTGFGGSVYGCSIRTVALLVLQSPNVEKFTRSESHGPTPAVGFSLPIAAFSGSGILARTSPRLVPHHKE